MIQEHIDFIDNLYEKLENSSEDITNLLMDFYYNKSTYLFFIKEFPDEAKNKIYTIFKYIIKNSNSLFKDNPYVISELVDLYKHSLQGFVVRPYMGDYQANNSNINTIFLMYEQYVDFKSFIKENNICDNTDEMNKSSIDSLVSEETERLFLESYIMNLNNGFFELDIELVKKLLNYVRNNEWIDNFINGNYKIDMYTRNFAYQYLTKFTFIKDFSTDEELVNDKLLNAIVKGKLIDYDLYNLVIDNVNIDTILKINNMDLNNFIYIIDNNLDDEVKNIQLVEKLFNKVLNEQTEVLFRYYIENKDNKYIKYYFNSENKLENLYYKVGQVPIKYLNNTIIEYILENDLYIYNLCFLFNFYMYSQDNEITQRQRELFEPLVSKYKLNCCVVGNNEFIKKIVDKSLEKGKQINIMIYVSVVNTLINYILGTKANVNYYIKSNASGYYSNEDKEIGIAIKDMMENIDINNEDSYKQFVRILVNTFNTVFHECTHYQQYLNIENDDNKLDFLKNIIIRTYYPNYYEKNYNLIDYEVDARIKAYENTLNYLLENFPNFVDIYKSFNEQDYLLDLKLDYSKKKMFNDKIDYDIDFIFDRLVQLHPDIISRYPVLKKYYDENGNKIEISFNK